MKINNFNIYDNQGLYYNSQLIRSIVINDKQVYFGPNDYNVFVVTIPENNTTIYLGDNDTGDNVLSESLFYNNWGDGTKDNNVSHTYATAGNYIIFSKYHLYCNYNQTGSYKGAIYITDVLNIRNDSNNINFYLRTASISNGIKIRDGVTNIKDLFAKTNLSSYEYEFPETIIDMTGAFYRASNLSKVNSLPNSAQKLYGTFHLCTSLLSAPIIGENVVDIRKIFEGCFSLKGEVKILSKIITLDNIVNSLKDCNNLTLSIPSDSVLAQYTDNQILEKTLGSEIVINRF